MLYFAKLQSGRKPLLLIQGKYLVLQMSVKTAYKYFTLLILQTRKFIPSVIYFITMNLLLQVQTV